MPVPRPASPLLKTACVAAAASLAIGFSATGSQAVPGDPAPPAPTTSAAALSQLRTLSSQLERVSKQYQDAQTLLGKRKTAAKAAGAKAQKATRAAAGYRGRIKQLVTSQARSDPFGKFGAMLTSDSPGDFAAQASLLEAVAARRSAVLSAATTASAAATKAETEAKAATAAAAKLSRELAVKKADLTRRTAQSKAAYDRLSAAERRAFLASAGEPADRASRAEPRATEPPPANVPVSGRAAAAVASARAQIGKPYVWGATGPGSFDCSGLTSYVWRQAGVSLPRTSRDQYAAGVKVSRSSLQPGDLVYFGSPIYHVAIYIGGGTMITAPQPGQVVKYQALTAFSDYTGATRPS